MILIERNQFEACQILYGLQPAELNQLKTILAYY